MKFKWLHVCVCMCVCLFVCLRLLCSSALENDFISNGGAFSTTNAILCNQIEFNN